MNKSIEFIRKLDVRFERIPVMKFENSLFSSLITEEKSRFFGLLKYRKDYQFKLIRDYQVFIFDDESVIARSLLFEATDYKLHLTISDNINNISI